VETNTYGGALKMFTSPLRMDKVIK